MCIVLTVFAYALFLVANSVTFLHTSKTVFLALQRLYLVLAQTTSHET